MHRDNLELLFQFGNLYSRIANLDPNLCVSIHIFCSESRNVLLLIRLLEYFNVEESEPNRSLNSTDVVATVCYKLFEHIGDQLHYTNSITIFYQFPLFVSSRYFIIRFRKGWF
jgi:hypothetical protein